MAVLRAAHGDLLQRRRSDGTTPGLLREVDVFIRRAQATGAWMDADEDRWTCQSLLDYWSNILFRAGHAPLDASLAEFDPDLAPELPDEPCPYVGLAPFQEVNQEVFFGRERLIRDWIGRLEHRLLLVVGSSGSGKSSLVRGGLVPALKAGALPGSQTWRYLSTIVPGADPLGALARLLKPAGRSDDEWTERQVELLRREPGHLAALIEQLDDRSGRVPTVLIVDQFEELFTLCGDDGTRRAFVDNLLGLIQNPDAGHRLILTMRSDFESNVARHPALHALLETAQVGVTPLNASELREAVEGPAEYVGLKYDAGIVDELVQEVLGEPAALPLLQFTLLKLWEQRDRNRITREVYERVGGPRTALERSADAFYRGLIPQDQAWVRRILLRIVRPGEGLEVTSNRVRRESLYRSDQDRERVDHVLDRLVQAGLVRVTKGDAPEHDQVEVAHEAIIRNWPRLVAWLDNERQIVRLRVRLTTAAEQWKAAGRDPDLLWRGSQLNQGVRYEDLNELEAEFIQAGRAAIEEAARQEELARKRELEQAQALAAARQRELEQAQALAAARERELEQARALTSAEVRAARRLRAFLVILALVAFASLVLGFLAAHNEVVAVSRGLSLQALSLSRDRPELALLLSLESAQAADTLEGLSSRLGLQERFRHLSMLVRDDDGRGHTGRVSSLAFSPDGRTLVSSGCAKEQPGGEGTASCGQSEIRLWDVSNGGALSSRLPEQTTAVSTLAFSPNGRTLALGGADGSLMLWDVPAGGPLGPPLAAHTSAVVSLAFSRDGHTLASSGCTIEPSNGAERSTMPEVGPKGPRGPEELEALAGGGGVCEQNGVRLWDVANSRPFDQQITLPMAPVASLAFSPDREILATGGEDGSLTLWNVATGKPRGSPQQSQLRHRARVVSLAFSPDGRTLASGGEDKTMVQWNVEPFRPRDPMPLIPQASAAAVAISPDGRMLASAGCKKIDAALCDQRELALWDVSTRRRIGPSLSGHTAPIVSVAFGSLNGRTMLASATDDGKLILWDVTTRQPLDAASTAGNGDAARVVAYSPDGTRSASSERTRSASGDLVDTVILWDVASRRPSGEPLGGHAGFVMSLAFSPDGSTLASGSRDKTMILWDVATGTQIGDPLAGHTAGVVSLAFSPDGRTLASGNCAQEQSDEEGIRNCGQGEIRLWHVATGTQIGDPLVGHRAPVVSLAFSPDGRTLASGGRDSSLILWDVAGSAKVTLSGQTAQVMSLAFNPDGRKVASGHYDGALILWDVATGRQIGDPLVGHAAPVVSLAFSRDGSTLASGSRDKTMILWDVVSRRQLTSLLTSHTASLATVSFSPDGKTLITGGREHAIMEWPYERYAWRDRVCPLVRRDLTLEEKTQYLDTSRLYNTWRYISQYWDARLSPKPCTS